MRGQGKNYLARMKKHSSLTSGQYVNDESASQKSYFGVFVEKRPYLLIESNGRPSARFIAENIANSANFRTLLEATATPCTEISVGLVSGDQINWDLPHTAIFSSPPGQLETGMRPITSIKAILITGAHFAIAETLCVDQALGSIIDPENFLTEDPTNLPHLSQRDQMMIVTSLSAEKFLGVH